MPLTYDDAGGSWAIASESWPSIDVPKEMVDKFGHRNPYYPYAATCHCLCDIAGVPYGSYVIMDNKLRLETEVYVEKVKAAIASITMIASRLQPTSFYFKKGNE